MILKDEDLTMVRRSEVGFKRINTLSHYRVLDGDVMSLIPRQTSTSCYDLSSVTDRSSFQHRYGQHTITTDAAAAADDDDDDDDGVCFNRSLFAGLAYGLALCLQLFGYSRTFY